MHRCAPCTSTCTIFGLVSKTRGGIALSLLDLDVGAASRSVIWMRNRQPKILRQNCQPQDREQRGREDGVDPGGKSKKYLERFQATPRLRLQAWPSGSPGNIPYARAPVLVASYPYGRGFPSHQQKHYQKRKQNDGIRNMRFSFARAREKKK